MTLTKLYEKIRPLTDKSTIHDYINGYYNKSFSDTSTPIKLLEIGVYKGGSLKLWAEHFGPDSKIYGFDIDDIAELSFIDAPNIFYELKDAYSEEVINSFENEYFNFIVDDGPHTLQSQIDCITKWWPKLAIGGKMIIEDIQRLEDVTILSELGSKYGEVTIFDLRNNKGRYDDIIIEILKIE